MRIVLIGFMGSGKSTIGKIIAQKTQRTFIDLDTYIESKEQRSVAEIFRTEGEDKFRIIESSMLAEVLLVPNMVLSVGGGTPCFYDNMGKMNEAGISVYLKMSADNLLSRLMSLPEQARQARPLLANKSREALFEYITETLKQRERYYSRAKMQVTNDAADIGLVADRIVKAIELY